MTPVARPLREPWVITPEGKAKVLSVYEHAKQLGVAARIAERMERAEAGEAFANERNAEVRGGVAVVSIDGPLMRKADLFSDISGATSYQWISGICDEIEMLHAAGQVKAALFVFNTPGGEAAGCGVCGDRIRALAQVLPVEGYAETQAASGGQWLISQCPRVTAHRQAFLGSLGVRSMIVDTSEMEEKAGIEVLELVATGSPKKRNTPVDDAVIERAQTLIDDIFTVFIEAVATGRGVTVAEAQEKYGQGEQLIADKALEAGLIDEIADLESVLARLQAGDTHNGPAIRKGMTMTMKNQSAAVAAPPAADSKDGEWNCKGCNQPMGASADAYCAHCMEGDDDEEDEEDEESKALAAAGLLGKTRKATRAGLAAFVSNVLEATSAKTGAAALAQVVAGARAKQELEAFRAQVEQKQASERAEGLAKGIATAIAAGRVTIGRVCKEVPLMLGASKAAARAALEAIPETLPQTDEDKAAGKKPTAGWTAGAVVKALASVPISVEAAESVGEWLDAQASSALPRPVAPVAPDHPAAVTAINQAKPSAGQIPDVSFADEGRRMRSEGNKR